LYCALQVIDAYLEMLAATVRPTLILSLPSQLALKLDDSLELASLKDWFYVNVRCHYIVSYSDF